MQVLHGCVWDEFSEYLLETRFLTLANHNTHPLRIIFSCSSRLDCPVSSKSSQLRAYTWQEKKNKMKRLLVFNFKIREMLIVEGSTLLIFFIYSHSSAVIYMASKLENIESQHFDWLEEIFSVYAKCHHALSSQHSRRCISKKFFSKDIWL